MANLSDMLACRVDLCRGVRLAAFLYSNSNKGLTVMLVNLSGFNKNMTGCPWSYFFLIYFLKLISIILYQPYLYVCKVGEVVGGYA